MEAVLPYAARCEPRNVGLIDGFDGVVAKLTNPDQRRRPHRGLWQARVLCRTGFIFALGHRNPARRGWRIAGPYRKSAAGIGCGGRVEDLLPFSEEALQRAVSAARTPVVSAIGHEPDSPVLDNVADLRAATPTDAAKRVVPDVAEEHALLDEARARMAQAVGQWVARERNNLDSLRSRPVLADPRTPINARRDELDTSLSSIRREMRHVLGQETSRVAALRGQVSALGPASTLERGYSIVQVLPRDGDAEVVTTIDQSPPGSQLRIRVSDGSITAAGMGTQRAD